MAMDCCSLRNPNPSNFGGVPLRKPSIPCFSTSPSTLSLRRNHHPHHFLPSLSATSFVNTPAGISGSALLSVRHRRSVLPLASSHEDSTPLEVEYEKEKREGEREDKESEEAWEQALASFKEQALRLQGVSQEAYETYSQKAMVALKETADKLKIEADKAKGDLTIMAQELREEIAQAAENSPEPVKEVVETFAYATDNVKDVSEVHDFYVAIPYGAILSIGGFVDFMVTGRTSAVRFGIILGGALLALGLSSLKSWRIGEASDKLILKSELAIAGFLFLREFRLLFQKVSFPGLFGTALSGAVATFFVYRLVKDNYTKQSNIDGEPQI